MNRTASFGVTLAPVAMAASLLVEPAAHADDRTCRGSIGTAQVDDNVIVPRGATCTLNGTRVDGNVEVRSGATLIARGVRVGRQHPAGAGRGRQAAAQLAPAGGRRQPGGGQQGGPVPGAVTGNRRSA